MASSEIKQSQRPIRSFVKREGRLTPGQLRALDELWPRYGIENGSPLLDMPTLFGNEQPVILEIGFGNGELLAHSARQQPQFNYLGIEVHRPGVGHLLLQLADQQIENVRVLSTDAMEVLAHQLAPHCLQAIWLFFPDPWPKKKHHKRRIVQPRFLDQAVRTLAPGGFLHMATDWPDYAEHMQLILADDMRFEIADRQNYQQNILSQRPRTKFEHRGQRKGHPITDLIYQLR